MSNVPPQQNFSNYPRANELDVERLESLVNGCLGLNRPFLINFLVLIGLNVLIRGTNLVNSEIAALGIVVAIPVVLFFLARPEVMKVGKGLGWSDATVTGYTILIALLFWLCFGGIGFMVVQGKAMNGIKGFGFQGGLFSTNKKALRAFVETMKAGSTNPGSVPPMSL